MSVGDFGFLITVIQTIIAYPAVIERNIQGVSELYNEVHFFHEKIGVLQKEQDKNESVIRDLKVVLEDTRVFLEEWILSKQTKAFLHFLSHHNHARTLAQLVVRLRYNLNLNPKLSQLNPEL